MSFRGIDNASYYKAEPGDPSRDLDCTGCGNTLDVSHPRVMQMVLDSLRHWVTAYGIAGFRFDLASSLGRSPVDFTPRAAFFQAVAQDPVLARVKMVAEPWDIGMGATSSAATRAAGASGTTGFATPPVASGAGIGHARQADPGADRLARDLCRLGTLAAREHQLHREP